MSPTFNEIRERKRHLMYKSVINS